MWLAMGWDQFITLILLIVVTTVTTSIMMIGVAITDQAAGAPASGRSIARAPSCADSLSAQNGHTRNPFTQRPLLHRSLVPHGHACLESESGMRVLTASAIA